MKLLEALTRKQCPLHGVVEALVESLVGHTGVDKHTVGGHLMLVEVQSLQRELQRRCAEGHRQLVEPLEENLQGGVANDLPVSIEPYAGEDLQFSSHWMAPEKVKVVYKRSQ